jgi:steroid delta-isomerase-like uncharacterized protein
MPRTSPPSAAGSTDDLKAIVRRDFMETWGQGRIEVIDELFGSDFLFHITGSPEFHGLEGYRQHVKMYRAAFPDISFNLEDQIAEGDKVVTRFSASGTHKGEVMGVAATGLHVPRVTGITIHRISHGRIVELWANWDALGLLQDMGVVPRFAAGPRDP